MAKILVLEDNIDVVDTLVEELRKNGYAVEAETDSDKALEKVRSFQPDLITLDVSFGSQKDEAGIRILQDIRKEYTKEQLPVLIVSGTLNADKLTRLLNLGAESSLQKPVKTAELLKKIEDCLDVKMNSWFVIPSWESKLVANSPVILELIEKINQAAKAESALMISGESGVGKEQVVNKYRELSPRKHKAFQVIDCARIQSELFETQVFGYEPGAFTGAKELKIGKVEKAQGGILYFDEIGELTEEYQIKLLRLLENRTFERVSGTKEIQLDAVILTATNRDLHSMVQNKKFREDLYYRLKKTKLEMPPLREHMQDIPYLVEHFIHEANYKYNKKVMTVDPELLLRMQKMTWPGNIRELKESILAGVLECEGHQLRWKDVEDYFKEEMSFKSPQNPESVFNLNLQYDKFKDFLEKDRFAKETAYYRYHLKNNKFNVSKTAIALGIDRTQLNSILKRLSISREEDLENTDTLT